MTVIVTGGAGFVGSNLVKALRSFEHGERIVSVDCVENTDDADRLVRDVSNDTDMAQLVDAYQPRAIIHLAAQSYRSADASAGLMVGFNAVSTNAVLRAALSMGRDRYPIVIIAGSAAEYGDIPPKDKAPTEQSSVRPNDAYAISKVVSTMTAIGYQEQFGLPVRVLRFGNIYGPGQRGKFIPQMLHAMATGKTILLNGDGLQLRPWLNIADAIYAISCALLANVAPGIYNIAEPQERTNRDIAWALVEAFQTLYPTQYTEDISRYIVHIAGSGGTRRVAMNTDRARYMLGWKPRVSLTYGMRELVEYHFLQSPRELAQ